jgi:glycosyltransferase involved in cell wall biosynthesis
MRILFVSGFWPSFSGNSGVSLSAREHAQMLIDVGCEVFILGSESGILDEKLFASGKFHISAKGSGALYSPAKVDKASLNSVILKVKPDLVIVEALQTAIGDASILVAAQHGFPVLLISHGVSVHPFTKHPIDFLRSLAWLPYRWFKLPKLVSQLSGMACLSLNSYSKRFFDRDLAIKFGVPVYHLNNFPINLAKTTDKVAVRVFDLLLVGYFSRVKNQLEAINILSKLPCSRSLVLIGEKSGVYYKKCVDLVRRRNLQDRVTFLSDSECSIASMIGLSKLLLLTSITEVQPIVLLEAMASGTPFVASNVGCVPDLRGGYCSNIPDALVEMIQEIDNKFELWTQYSVEGIDHYKKFHTREVAVRGLSLIIGDVLQIGSLR